MNKLLGAAKGRVEKVVGRDRKVETVALSENGETKDLPNPKDFPLKMYILKKRKRK